MITSGMWEMSRPQLSEAPGCAKTIPDNSKNDDSTRT